jgi:hypothetical protein
MPDKVMGYTVRSSPDLDSLRGDVNLRISEGWQPLGGVSVNTDKDGDTTYTQAMTLAEGTP